MEHQLVVFEMENEHYGVDIASVESIIKMQEITRLPHTPGYMEGITNLRGQVLPVIDLRARFGMPKQEPTRNTRIVVAAMNGAKAGLVVDAVTQVVPISDDVIEPAPQMAMSISSAYIKGLAKLENRLVILLDLDKVLEREGVAA